MLSTEPIRQASWRFGSAGLHPATPSRPVGGVAVARRQQVDAGGRISELKQAKTTHSPAISIDGEAAILLLALRSGVAIIAACRS